MRPAWRLATSSFSGRRLRAGLLVAAIALSAALIAGVSSVMASITESVQMRLTQTVGQADVSILPARADTMVARIAELAREWPETEAATGLLRRPLALRFETEAFVEQQDGSFASEAVEYRSSAMGNGVDRAEAWGELSIQMIAGRLPERPGEVVIDVLTAERLSWYYANRKRLERRDEGRAERGFGISDRAGEFFSVGRTELPERVESEDEADRVNAGVGARIGDTIRAVRLLRGSTDLEVVGIAAQPPLGGRPQVYAMLDTIGAATGKAGELSEVLVELKPEQDAVEIAALYNERLGESLLVQTTAKIVSGVEKNMASSKLGFWLASVLAFLSASFIILTGLSTDVTERQRELAMMRCVGAGRWQLARAQLAIGMILGSAGAGIGVPLGVAASWIIVASQSQQIPAGLVVSPVFLAVSAAGSVLAGVAGAAYPAWKTARMSPLEGLSVRSRPASVRGIRLVLLVALVLQLVTISVVGLPDDGQTVFWGYATVGLPLMMVGYFLLGVPLTATLARLLGPTLDKALGLPKGLLSRTVSATPYRHGLTAGAMMAGLGMMVSIWTSGGAVLRDWLDKITFPDAFVSGLNLTEGTRDRLEALDFVERTCAITLEPVEVDAFGVRALQNYKTSFVAFEPTEFFAMTNLEWIQGDVETALPKLEAGGSVIVAREFLVAQGLGLGDRFVCRHDSAGEFDFEIVGVVTSPGIEIVSKFFNIGEDYTEQAVHAVFGSRKDLNEKFGVDTVHLFQVDLAEDVSDAVAIDEIRDALFEDAILDTGSGRRIKREIMRFVGGSLFSFSLLAVVAMLVACFGVANVIVASIQTRAREFGVLRAVGAQRGTVARLVLGEAVVIAAAAALLGTALGIQASWASGRINALLLGIDLGIRPPVVPILAGWAVVLIMCVGAALPAVLRLSKRSTRALLAG